MANWTPPRLRLRAFTLIDLMIVVAILGILAALVIPQYGDATERAESATVASQLATVRRQIELYDSNNPGSPFNPLVPGGAAAWDQLVDNGYLRSAPTNPLQFESTAVGPVPGLGVGWVWGDPNGTGTSLYAVDENAAFFDADGNGTAD